MPQRVILFDNRERYVRALTFNDPQDPYFLTHPDENELSDARLRERKVEYDRLPRPFTGEVEGEFENKDDGGDEDENSTIGFESFLEWLEEERGYDRLISAGEVMDFSHEW